MNYRSPSDGVDTVEYRSKPNHYSADALLNSTHLSELLFACPNIEILDIDLEMKEQSNYNLLDTTVSFPVLKKMVLRFRDSDAETWIHWSDELFPYECEGHLLYHLEAYETLMQRLAVYLKKKKVGKELEILKTWIGNLNVEN